jgi:hypothetical protein
MFVLDMMQNDNIESINTDLADALFHSTVTCS